MKYLILDKRQRVNTGNDDNTSSACLRLIEELDKKNLPHQLSYFDEVEIFLNASETRILVGGLDIKEFSHIIFRGHSLHKNKEYEIKRMIIDYCDQNKGTKVQNANAIKNLPYYNKIYLGLFCINNNLPYFPTYYKYNGEYKQRDFLTSYPLIAKEYTGINKFNEEGKIKKNVYKVDNIEELNPEILNENFFLQEFSDTGEDMRIFVRLNKVVAGWRRRATEGFMTVNKGEYCMYNKPDREICKIATKVSKKLQADFIAVDFMYLNGKPYIQEISLHPGFKAYETKITDGKPINIAEAIITAFR